MPDVKQQVQQAIETHGLLGPGDRVVVGVSGGPDSLCLLHVLHQLKDRYQVHLHVAHLNHGTRGGASDADAEFVERVAGEWGLPVTVEKRDVIKLADQHGLAFEETARRVRYAFLGQVARRVGASKVAVGHNADDQAETVLMHFLRGTGLAGLRGMRPVSPLTSYRLLKPFLPLGNNGHEAPLLIRPLLQTPRQAIETYCAEQNLRPRFDRSNLDTTYFRNRLRHELLPELETYNPNIRERLCHTAAVVAADYDLLVDLRRDAWDDVLRQEHEEMIVLDLTAWQGLPVALQRATLRHATLRLRRSLRDVTFRHVENAREVALEGETGKKATLPMGLMLTVGYDTLRIGTKGKTSPPPDEPLLWQDNPLPVPVPGTTPLPQSNWVLEARLLRQWSMTEITASDHPWTGYFDADVLGEPALLRPRHPGDRFQPYGMGGHTMKLSELLINLKVPEVWRDHVPLLVIGDEIVWVCGRRIAENAAVKPKTDRVAMFRFEHTA